MIEKYRRELMEFNKKSPTREAQNSSVAEAKKQVIETAAQTVASAPVIKDNTPYVERSAARNNADGSDNPVRILPSTGLVQLSELQSGDEGNVFIPPEDGNLIEEAPDATARVAEYASDAQKYPPYSEGAGGKFDGIQSFLDYNQKTGIMRVQVYAAGETFPISNAKIIIGKDFENSTNIFYTEFSDISGVVFGMTLPAPDKSLTEYPTALLPYATYDIIVEHPSFVKAIYKNCAIFDGIETIQHCELIPKAKNGAPDQAMTFDNARRREG